MIAKPSLDLLIVGGGINGVGIARDAAGRGLSVLLCEQDDLASHTSSASTKLIHGGLRYLEKYEFRLVRESLMERETLMAMAPHIIWPLRFVLPQNEGSRPDWMIRTGLFLYDHLAKRRALPGSQGVALAGTPYGAPLKDTVKRGYLYSDCWVEDARLVVLNAMSAREAGADIRTRTRFVRAERRDGAWEAEIEDVGTGRRETLRARILVNAAGPWVEELIGKSLRLPHRFGVRLVKGSHIVVPRLSAGPHAYIFQNRDGRIVFAIPYEERFTLIGTTDIALDGVADKARISSEEIDYLCRCAGEYFRQPVTPSDVVWTYSGIRPLFDDEAGNASVVTRDYVFDVDGGADLPPVLSIFGGKITTYRRLAEHALEMLAPFLPGLKPAWTKGNVLPGGDLPNGEFALFAAALGRRRPFLSPAQAHRLARAYGTRADAILGDARSAADLGRDFGGGLTEAEVDYLVTAEWARTAEDILWRRSKLGLHVPAETGGALQAYLGGGNIL